ncbi:MAG: hypothetical protein GXO83_07325 [Chlorobi bacterium]|nr:hypothetical protein [Chlorobiota bacterium]
MTLQKFKIHPFESITIVVFTGLLVPWLVRDGMFVDGVTYSTIARNMADGLGSFWQLHYTNTLYPVFYEQPPLAFGLQAVFFKVLGQGMMVERLYSFLSASVLAWLIALLWKQFVHSRKTSWLPVLMWITIPVIFWSYRNNMLENTMSIWDLASVIFIIKGVRSGKSLNGCLITGSVFILLAFLTKGLPGLFPLVVPFIYWLIFKQCTPGRMILQTFFVGVMAGFAFLIIYISGEGVRLFFTSYFSSQVWHSIEGHREIAQYGRISIFYYLILELWPAFLIMLLIKYVGNSKTKFSRLFYFGKNFWFFFYLGLSASLPLMISPKQSDYFLVPSTPFFALGFAAEILPYVEKFMHQMRNRFFIIVRIISGVTFAGILIIAVMNFGKPYRDFEILKDVYKIKESVDYGTVITANRKMCENWSLVAYLARINNNSLDCSQAKHDYILVCLNDNTQKWPPKYKPLNIGLINFILLHRTGY